MIRSSNRPHLPARFDATAAAAVKFALVAALFAGMSVVCIGALFAGSRATLARVVVFAVLGSFLLWLAAAAASRFVRSVVLEDEGLVVRGWFRSRRIRWTDLTTVELRYETKANQSGRAWAIVGGFLGFRRGRAAPLPAAADPYEHGELRDRHDAAAELLDSSGSRTTLLHGYLGWAFFDALRAEAEGRGLQVLRRSGITNEPA
jgi:hypothetical protein